MKMEYSFSLAKRSDTPEILKLYRSLIGTSGCIWHADYPNREIIESDIDAESLYVILDKKYKIVAVAAACKDSDSDGLTWNIKNPCDLARFGVLAENQNQGIGSLLLRKIIFTIKRKGYGGMRMFVSKNNFAARKLYSRHGFVQIGEVNMYGLDFDRYEMSF